MSFVPESSAFRADLVSVLVVHFLLGLVRIHKLAGSEKPHRCCYMCYCIQLPAFARDDKQASVIIKKALQSKKYLRDLGVSLIFEV